MNGPVQNTDRELYREDTGDPAGSYYENSIHVTERGLIGMNVGGNVIVQSIADWHAAAVGGPVVGRVTADEVTGIDEIVLSGVDVHIEALSDKSFTLIFTRPGGFWLQADLWAKRKPLILKLLEVDGADDVEIDAEAFK